MRLIHDDDRLVQRQPVGQRCLDAAQIGGGQIRLRGNVRLQHAVKPVFLLWCQSLEVRRKRFIKGIHRANRLVLDVKRLNRRHDDDGRTAHLLRPDGGQVFQRAHTYALAKMLGQCLAAWVARSCQCRQCLTANCVRRNQPQCHWRGSVAQGLASLGYGMGSQKRLTSAGGNTHTHGWNVTQRRRIICGLPALAVLFMQRRTGAPGCIQPRRAQLVEKAVKRGQCLLLVVLEGKHGQRALMS